MIDITVLILLILFPIFVIFIGWRLIAYYISDDFAKGFLWGKIVFILCITVAISAICFFPLDVANAGGSLDCGGDNGSCGGLNFTIIWYVIFILIVVLLIGILPFTVFFYETMDIDQPPFGKRMQSACSYTLIGIFVIAMLTWIFCAIINKANIDLTVYEVTVANTFFVGEIDEDDDSLFILSTIIDEFNRSSLSDTEMDVAELIKGTKDTLSISVSPLISMIAFFCILGWLFFVIFAGIGIIGLPYKLIYGFINRPTYMPKDRFNEEKKTIGVHIQGLIVQGESIAQMMENTKSSELGWKERRRLKKEAKIAIDDYRNACKELDDNYLSLRADHLNYKDNNPLLPVAKLLFGFLSIIASLLWILQLAFYVFPKQFTGYAFLPFLNSLFISLNNFMPILSSALLLAFALYFMFCTINGAFSFGLRMFFMNVHEMSSHDTLITSLVFNGGLILLVVLPLLQFCSKAFGDYAAQSEIIGIFGVQIEYLEYISFLFKYNVFLWILLAFMIFASFYYSCRKSDKERKLKKTKEKLKADDKHGIELKKMKNERDKKDMA